MALKMDLRLLSYLLAYIVCQLPALPAFVMAGLAATDHAGCPADPCDWPRFRDGLTWHQGVWWNARQVVQPLQGLANALVFAHHARRRYASPFSRAIN